MKCVLADLADLGDFSLAVFSRSCHCEERSNHICKVKVCVIFSEIASFLAMTQNENKNLNLPNLRATNPIK
ncbi:hypothetical protein EV144_1011259 [Flavobacterium sp. 270]|nr:hypothetical protein EV144_1011259 [Flavobacterium sp. 270]